MLIQKNRDFNAWMGKFKRSIYDYSYYVDFEKVKNNVDEIKVELGILNSLVGSKDITADFISIIQKYPETLKCIPILLAIRRQEIFVKEQEIEYLFNFRNMNYSPEQYAEFMDKMGLFDLISNRSVTNLIDYVTGVETGLDSNARKNRGGKLMEALVESYIKAAGFEKNISYFREMNSTKIMQNWNIDLSPLTNMRTTVKRFDFVVKTDATVYAIETNFYSGGGSKLNETARSYKMLALESKNILGFKFVWITDGTAWSSAKRNLKETFDELDMLYCIDDMENGILTKVLI
ncbi:MAG: restriction endonuclease [Candidatus Cloacimonetes bacterium]|jgi:type II restriction enzyme|nr:restriction endonuclease [Candidatus Cloacimonadota bacterium]